MERNKMIHVQGPPWKTSARYATFEEADIKRVELLKEENLQVKVRWLRSAVHKAYAIKTRIDPSTVVRAKNNKKKHRKK
jgi:hypothetical protein